MDAALLDRPAEKVLHDATPAVGSAVAQLRHFRLLATGLDVAPVLAQLDARPDLWNAHRQRLDAPDSPHAQAADIWVRFRPAHELRGPGDFLAPHFAEFYPAWHALPALHPIVFGLMAQQRATYLGGILITRIPPGGRILPHHDRGGWHAEHHDLKVYVPLRSTPECINLCEGERVAMLPGTAWSFDNLRVHAVENNSDRERITVIVCMRTA